MKNELEAAWKWRSERGFFSETEALRVFHGPGEGSGELAQVSVDLFGKNFWITEWKKTTQAKLKELVSFYESREASSIVLMFRSETDRKTFVRPEVIFGKPPQSYFQIKEEKLGFWISFQDTRHPGLFLDHFPLRSWLSRHVSGQRVLNTFSYTGSLSVASGRGGAQEVVTLDLSGAALEWAKKNWELNGISARSEFIAGDVFERLPRFRKEGREFDCVILDPPSFSRGKKGTFSTSKDLARLHELAFQTLAKDGLLITSINSANISESIYLNGILKAAKAVRKDGIQILKTLELPETFPTRADRTKERYLKGWIIKS